eukprot:10156-Rhodomonas_salina.1
MMPRRASCRRSTSRERLRRKLQYRASPIPTPSKPASCPPQHGIRYDVPDANGQSVPIHIYPASMLRGSKPDEAEDGSRDGQTGADLPGPRGARVVRALQASASRAPLQGCGPSPLVKVREHLIVDIGGRSCLLVTWWKECKRMSSLSWALTSEYGVALEDVRFCRKNSGQRWC